MNTVVRNICAVLIMVLFPCPTYGQSDEIEASLQELTDEIRSETGIPGISVFVISKTCGAFGVVSGTANLDTGALVTGNTVFRMGSITKTFTGAAILNLVSNGLLDPDEAVTAYLDLDYPVLEGVTVRHLLTHSSGLIGYLNETDFLVSELLGDPDQYHLPLELIDAALADQDALKFEAGTAFDYNNTNYVLLGLLIEEVSGTAYEDYISDKLLAPLRLDDITYPEGSAIPGDDTASGYYDADEDSQFEDWTETDMSYVWSAGALTGTARDLAKWMYLLGRRLVDNADFADLQLQGMVIDDGIIYGGGLVVDENKGIGHNGTVVGFHADAWYRPEYETAIAVLSNANMIETQETEGRDPTLEIVEGFFELLSGE